MRTHSTEETCALRVDGLGVEYTTRQGRVRVVRDVSLELHRKRVLGVVGESGSGKSTVALAATGWTDASMVRTSGSSVIRGVDLCALPPRELRTWWGRTIGYVPQEIGGALHPTFRIGSQFRETLRVNTGLAKRAADARAVELLDSVNVPEPHRALKRYAHEFSGGQLQRIALALALAPGPDVLILDEPTTGLDVTSQELVASVLRNIVTERNVAVLFISHDLALLSEIADDVAVMYAGEVVESGPTDVVLRDPRHPYSRALLDALPSPAVPVITRGIAGLPPGRVVDHGCAFAPRCAHSTDRCTAAVPFLTRIGEQAVRCIRASSLDLAPAVMRRRNIHAIATPPVLDVRDLTCRYSLRSHSITAVAQAALCVREGSVTALVGESGSGKSTLGKAIAGVIRPVGGTITLDGGNLALDPRERTTDDRHRVQLIFQNSSGTLNPRQRIGDHLAHVAKRFVRGDPEARRAALDETLDAVQIAPDLLDRYPGQLSGGQRQRVAIAAAFVALPRLVICDEITSGQDVSVQASVLATLSDVQRRYGTAVLFISHDLGVVRSIADEIYVMQHGRIVESGQSERVFERPAHAYTRALLAAVPAVAVGPLPGQPDDMNVACAR